MKATRVTRAVRAAWIATMTARQGARRFSDDGSWRMTVGVLLPQTVWGRTGGRRATLLPCFTSASRTTASDRGLVCWVVSGRSWRAPTPSTLLHRALSRHKRALQTRRPSRQGRRRLRASSSALGRGTRCACFGRGSTCGPASRNRGMQQEGACWDGGPGVPPPLSDGWQGDYDKADACS